MSSAVTIDKAIPFPGCRDGVDYTAHLVTFDGFEDAVKGEPPHALIFGSPQSNAIPLVRVHSGCRTGDTFGSKLCDCGDQLTDAIRTMASASYAALLYLPHHEGRGIGLNQKIRAYDLMQKNPAIDTYEANRQLGHSVDARDYRAAAQMLHALHITELNLLTGNPAKMESLQALGNEFGFEIKERIPTRRFATAENIQYLSDKENTGNHIFLPPTP